MFSGLYANTNKMCAVNSVWNPSAHRYMFDAWLKPIVLIINQTKIGWIETVRA
jgi:hypothetical protein